MLNEMQDVARAKGEKWRKEVGTLTDKVTQGEEVIARIGEELGGKLDFWESVKANPAAPLSNAAL